MAIALVGPPGAGKTVVGALLASRLRCQFIDVDAEIEAAAGLSVAQLFEQRGEAAFRELELASAEKALGEADAVVSLGGGAVTQPVIRQALQDCHVVWLDVSAEEAARRTAAEPGQRPLLGDDPAGRISELILARRGLYAEVATWRIDTTSRNQSQVVGAVEAALSDSAVDFTTDHPYQAVVGYGAITRLAPLVAGSARVAVIASPALAYVAAAVRAEVEVAGAEPYQIDVPVGEAAKTPAVMTDCWRRLAEAGLTRSDLIVGVGGGATTDLAGFVAASYLRGVDWVAVPTSVVGMLDAAIGGKTGIDLPEGKNLVGAFHEPRAVLADYDTLATLPRREVCGGLAEAIKEGFTDDPAILGLVEADPVGASDVGGKRLARIISQAVRVKADVVAGDLRERTSADEVGRERLNYGHTLGHAIEAYENFELHHGEAVAIGCVFAAEVAHRLLGLPDGVVDRHRSILASVGLPTTYSGAAWEDLRALMARDKKTRGSSLRLVLLRGIGDVVIVKDPPEDVLRASYEALM